METDGHNVEHGRLEDDELRLVQGGAGFQDVLDVVKAGVKLAEQFLHLASGKPQV